MPQPAPPDPKTAPSAPDVSTSETWDPTAFDPPDFYDLEALLSEEARHVRDNVRTVVTEEVMPIIEKYAQRGEFPRHLISTFAEHGLLGSTLPPEYGGEGHSNIAYGLIMQELERGACGDRWVWWVRSGLVWYPLGQYGSECERDHGLPPLGSGEAMGCFGVTEPDVGSNPDEMKTRARRDGDGWVIDGHKRWSTNATIADVAVIWAKDEDDTVRGFLVETDRDGVETPPIDDSWSLRAAVTSEVVLDDVRVPDAARLPEVSGLKGPLSCLTQARYGICWGTIGAAMACFDTARQHAQNREQFGGPIGRFQLMQERLVDMVQEITKAQLLNWRLGTLKEAGTMRPQQVSLAKRNNCQTALDVARSARQVLGGNGVTSMYPVMRHMNNLESVVTYEGTHEVHTLIVGEDVTGLNAFT